jgi:expansin
MKTLIAIPLVLPALVLFAACSAAPAPGPTPPAPADTAIPAAPATAPVAATAPPPATATAIASAAPAAPATSTPAEAPKPAETAKPADPAKPAVAEKSGEAVFYDANARGACSLTFGHEAAVISAPDVVYNKIQACGQCLEVTGPAGTAVVQVVDRCHTCADNLLVINKPAFEKIAGKALGRASIHWKPVACDVSGNLELRIKKTSSAYWTAIQVRNHRVPVKSVAFKKGDKWIEMSRSDDNYFVAEKGVGDGAITLRIQSDDGQTVEHTLDKWKDGETYNASVQFK